MIDTFPEMDMGNNSIWDSFSRLLSEGRKKAKGCPRTFRLDASDKYHTIATKFALFLRSSQKKTNVTFIIAPSLSPMARPMVNLCERP